MMYDVLQADQRDDQKSEGSPPAKQIAKEIRKKEANKADIQS